MNNNFQELKNYVYNFLENNKLIVLATSSNNLVSARTMSYIVIDEKILFQTDSNYTKAKQIKDNPNVALCIDNIQIEGIANILGHPFNIENKDFLDKYKKIHNSSYTKYSNLDNEIVIEIIPHIFTIWTYENGKGILKKIDLTKETIQLLK